jgi:hypothetical protein
MFDRQVGGLAGVFQVGRVAFRRSTAALAGATERSNSAQAALHAKERAPALPAVVRA